ncbi:hypothetical protein J4E91_002421 [Alternaria rosae]|nr:hypothetical protein J4E91_002421 [Alternaria rosae]
MENAKPFRSNRPTLEAAEAELSRLLAEEISVQTELDKFKNKVAELETRRTTVGKDCQHLSRIVAEKLCRNFVDKFHAILPPELREMVYDYVWNEPMLRLVFDDVTLYEKTSNTTSVPLSVASTDRRGRANINSAPWSVPCGRNTCRCFHWQKLPFWVQHQYVGKDVAKEVAKAYYRNMHACQLDADHLNGLTDLLSEDHFHLDVKPVDHIRRLELSLAEDAYIQDEDRLKHSIQSKKGQDIFQHHFEKLLDVRVKKDVHLTIKLKWDGARIYCTPALERSRRVVNALMNEGAIVTVVAWEKSQRAEYNVSDYYALAPEDWQAKWIKKVRKDQRLEGRHSDSYVDSWMAFIENSSQVDNDIVDNDIVDNDLMDDSEQENLKDEAFVKALAGLEGPKRSVSNPFADYYTLPDDDLNLWGSF